MGCFKNVGFTKTKARRVEAEERKEISDLDACVRETQT